mgnify:CR=1 FL=1
MKKFRTTREIIEAARKKIKPKVWKWLDGSAEYGHTTSRNRETFRKISLIPRVLNNTLKLNVQKKFFGKTISSPIIISPVGGLNQFNYNAEHLISKASEKNKVPYFFPNNTSQTLEQMNPNKDKELLCTSLYLDDDPSFIKKSIIDAVNNNCHCISITVDSPVRPYSYNKMDQGYDARNYFKKKPLIYSRKKKGHPILWKHIAKIRKLTKKPIILKGILSKQDAKTACNLGVDGVWVSNHGGRALETDITAIEVLEKIKSVIPKKIIIIADGGIRTGTDILKTINLGADFVGIGRPIAYGMIADSKTGIDTVLSNLISEFTAAMRMAGISSLDQIKNIETIKRF